MFQRNKDVMMVMALMGIIVAMVMPMPAFMLDIFLFALHLSFMITGVMRR